MDGNAVENILKAGAEAADHVTVLVGPELDEGGVVVLRVPDGYDLKEFDQQKYQPQSRRKTGMMTVRNAASFIGYVNTHKGAPTVLLARDNQVEAIFNHHPVDDSDGGGWNDFRCRYELKLTPAWTGWTGNAGKLITQQALGEWLEENAIDVIDPPGATLLEVAMNLRGKLEVTFDKATNLSNGSVQLQYREDLTAQGGVKGTMEVPTKFTLGLACFDGGERYEIPALLRWRLNGGHVQWMWKFGGEVKAIFDEAFERAIEQIARETGLPVLRGSFA